MKQEAIAAETRGKTAFAKNWIQSHHEATKFARREYNSEFLRDCFVAGWNTAFWDEQARVLREGE